MTSDSSGRLPNIPEDLLAAAAEIAAVARKYELDNLNCTFRPGFGSPVSRRSNFKETLEMQYIQGRHGADNHKFRVSFLERHWLDLDTPSGENQ